MKICNSCAMPMATPELYGSNKDGTPNDTYCTHCYPKGEFNNPNETLEEMINSCVPFMAKDGMNEDQARSYLNNTLKDLKRWTK